jgi:hypothetical protein
MSDMGEYSMRDHSEKARQIILEIVRQSANHSLMGRTRLYKAFYFAHLYYLGDFGEFLSGWPIVRMPNGPGIDKFDTLIQPLLDRGDITARSTRSGPFPTTRFTARRELQDTSLSESEVQSIQKAVEYIHDKQAGRLSEITHEYSRSWQESENGDELQISLDLMTDEEVAAVRSQQEEIARDVAAIFS